MKAKKSTTLLNRQSLVSLSMLLAAALACNSVEPAPTLLPLTESAPTPIPATPTPIVGDFWIQDANTTPPDDVWHEVSNTIFSELHCVENYDSPTIEAPQSAGWLEPIEIFICHVNPEEEIKLTITFPDDTKTNLLIKSASYVYRPSTDQQIGRYTFAFSGQSGQGEHNVKVSIPNEPRIYLVEDLQLYYLYGFVPQERIRFFLYSTPLGVRTGLTAWQAYYADNNGHLLINVHSEGGLYTAIGDISGIARNAENILLPDPAEFVRLYFTDICQFRTYDYFWTLLTDRFRGSSNYSEYVEWWDRVERVEIGNIDNLSWSGGLSNILIQLTFRFKDGTSSSTTIEYGLVFNQELGTWQFDSSTTK